MQSEQVTFRMPDLGLGETEIRVSVWHAEVGQPIEYRQRLVEVTAGDALVDLPSPATGCVAQWCVDEDELVRPGQALAIIDRDESSIVS